MPLRILKQLAAFCPFYTLCDHAEGLAIGLTIILVALDFVSKCKEIIFGARGFHDEDEQLDVEPEEAPTDYNELD